MKKQMNLNLLIVSGLLTALSVNAAPKKMADEPVDFNDVNPIIKAIADQVTANETQVEWAYPVFDAAQSSILLEKLSYSTTAQIKNTPWSVSDKASVQASVLYNTDRTSPLTGINVSFDTKLGVDLLSFVRYSAALAIKHAVLPNPGYQARVLALLTRATQVQSMDDLYKMIQQGQALANEGIQIEIKKRNDQVSCLVNMECGEPTIDQWGNHQPDYLNIAYTEKQIQLLMRGKASTDASVVSYQNGIITISNDAAQGFFTESSPENAEGRNIVATLAVNGVTASGKLFVYQSTAQLDKMRADFQSKVTNLVGGDPAAKADIQDKFRTALIAFKKYMNGNFR